MSALPEPQFLAQDLLNQQLKVEARTLNLPTGPGLEDNEAKPRELAPSD